MKVKNSFCNSTLLKYNIKRYGFISIILGLLLLLNFTFPLLLKPLKHLEDYVLIERGDDLFYLFTVPVILAMVLFAYMQKDKTVSFYHSLPMTRTELMNTQIISGIILYNLPVVVVGIINTIILLVFKSLNADCLPMMRKSDIVWSVFVWILSHFLIFMMNFLCAMVMGILVGNLVLQGVFFYVLVVLPYGLGELINLAARRIIYGLPPLNKFSDFLESWSIVGLFFKEVEVQEKIGKIVIFSDSYIRMILPLTLFYGVVAYFIGRWLYKRRQMENNHLFIAEKGIRKFFVAGFTLSLTLTIGNYIGVMTENKFIIYCGVIGGVVIGYWVSQMLVRKTLYVFGTYKGLLVYLSVVILTFVIADNDWINYEKRLPALDQITAIDYINSYYPSKEARDIMEQGEKYDFSKDLSKLIYQEKYRYTDQDSIQAIYHLHQKAINYKEEPKDRRKSAYIRYYLKNGDVVTRAYRALPIQALSDYEDLVRTKNYILNKNPFLWEIPLNYSKVVIESELRNKEYVFTGDEMNELIELMKQELLERGDYQENSWQLRMEKEQDNGFDRLAMKYYWEVNVNGKLEVQTRFLFNVDRNNKKLVEWLKEKEGIYSSLVLVPDNVKAISLLQAKEEVDYYRHGDYFEKEKIPVRAITDKKMIRLILKNTAQNVPIEYGIGEDREVGEKAIKAKELVLVGIYTEPNKYSQDFYTGFILKEDLTERLKAYVE